MIRRLRKRSPAVIEGLDYKVDKQVGSAGFKIDIAARHPDQPGRYMLAIECDGATYHSALWARERDRLRQEILKNMGWRFHRIWSTDWFYRRGEAIQKLKAALEDARVATSAPVLQRNGPRSQPPMLIAGAGEPAPNRAAPRHADSGTTGSPSAPRPATRSRMKLGDPRDVADHEGDCRNRRARCIRTKLRGG